MAISAEAEAAPAAHGIFTLARIYAASPERVYAAWSTVEGKSAWFGADAEHWVQQERQLDFRIGGVETLIGKWDTGVVTDYRAVYHASYRGGGWSAPTACSWTVG